MFFAFFNAQGAPASADNFILFLAVGLSAVGLAAVPIVNTVPQEPPPPERTTPATVRCRLLLGYFIVLVLALVLGAISLLQLCYRLLMREADDNSDGVLSVDEISRFVGKSLGRLWRTVRQGQIVGRGTA